MAESGCLKDGHFQNLEVVNTTILDTGNTTMTGSLTVTGNTGLTPGSGFSSAALFKSWRTSNGGQVITTVLIDLTGVNSGGGATDIIGNNSAASANIGQYTTAVMGTLYAVHMSCIETPTGGEPNINLSFADQENLAEDSAIGSGTNNGVLITAAGDLEAGAVVWGTDISSLSQNQYFYLSTGDGGTDHVYTAGVIKIEFYGTA